MLVTLDEAKEYLRVDFDDDNNISGWTSMTTTA